MGWNDTQVYFLFAHGEIKYAMFWVDAVCLSSDTLPDSLPSGSGQLDSH